MSATPGEKKKSITFNEKAKDFYQEAVKENRNQKLPEYYYAGTAAGDTKRFLDIKSEWVFCSQIGEESGMNRKEYRLQAYLIREALLDKQGWILPLLEDRKWRLIDAERNFANEDIRIELQKTAKKLDILAYDEASATYIVLELKAECGKDALDTAKKELNCCTDVIKNHLSSANTFYSETGRDVRGYIVCPRRKSSRAPIIGKTIEVPWGVIQYEREDIEELRDGKIHKIKFKLVKDPD